MAPDTFENLHDHAHVSRDTVRPLAVEPIDDLPAAPGEAGLELRLMPTLAPLRQMRETTLHVSGIRLRNATDWAL